jgi:drug/metabolite transporter (DMT)-like permease
VIPRRWLLLIVVASTWGATFLLIRVSARELSPLQILWGRLAIGALTVTPFALARIGGAETWRQIKTGWLRMIGTCFFTFLIPTPLLSWALRPGRIDSGLAAVIQASAPLFAALLALRLARHDTVGGMRLVGLFVGFAGVALVVGAQPSGDIASALVVTLVGFNYALSAIFSARWLSDFDPVAGATGMLWLAVLALLPFVLVFHPAHVPSLKPDLALFALGFFCTGLGFILYLTLMVTAGASFGVLLNYLVPGVALIYGAAILGESISPIKIAGLLVVLVGVGLGSGAIGRRRVVPLVPPEGA